MAYSTDRTLKRNRRIYLRLRQNVHDSSGFSRRRSRAGGREPGIDLSSGCREATDSDPSSVSEESIVSKLQRDLCFGFWDY